MSEELLKKLYGHIPTEAFPKIMKLFCVSSISSVYGIFQFNNMPFQIASSLMFFLSSVYLYPMFFLGSEEFSKDYCDLDEEYQLFLNNYSELMKSLDYNTVVDLCVIFKYMYKNGYLSIDGKFDKNKEEFFEGRRFQLVNIFNSCGICRHISRSLKDILNYNGFSSAVIPVYTRNLESLDEKDIEFLRNSIYGDFSNLKISKEKLEMLIESFISLKRLERQFEIDALNEEDLMERESYRINGNHLIVLTSDNNLSLVYDPMKGYFYEFQGKNKLELISDESYRFKVCLRYGENVNAPSDTKRYYKNLKLSSMSIAGLNNQQQASIDRLVDNIDMVEKFRKDNIPLMESLKNKAYKLK